MIRVDENDPVGEVQLSFPYRDVQIQRGVDPKEHYDLEEEIGRGKFGTVYKCREKTSGLVLAAKFVSVPKKEDKRNVEREVDIMKSLQHPRLIQLYDAFENGKVMCVVLEYIQGGELFERVIDDDFVLTEKSCAVFMRQICEGIDFIHKQRILHLDMKPENILCLTRTGNRVKIIDFGLARRFDPDKKLQVLFGTPEFVAPEVVNFDQIGFGTDMWSVGVICYVLLSGLSPFMGSTDVETMANVTIGKYDFDDDAFQEISENAKDFIRKLLNKDMSARITAEQCLNHDWLKRKTMALPRTSSLDATKDNLKQFVERWNDHPNSPYIFELTRQWCHLGSSPHSLLGDSPSPCGSLLSGSDSEPLVPRVEDATFDHMRRASDSTCIVKTSDVTNRLNLAEEIRKLSDRLFQLSTMPTNVTNSHFVFDQKSLELPTRSVPIKIGLPKDHPQSPECSVPWRKSRNRLNYMSRDVPLNLGTSVGSTAASASPSGTKDLLLKLLDKWDGTTNSKLIRHSSISQEWSEMESLEQRSMSSLNNFFQSRATSKKTHRFS